MDSIRSTRTGDTRKLRLRVLAKCMLAAAALVVLYVAFAFFFSRDDERPRLPGLVVDVHDMQAGDSQRVLWERRPVIIHRRTPADMAALVSPAATAAGRLRDPDSRRSEQPEAMRNARRSRDPVWFVAIALGMDQGCPVSIVDATDSEIPEFTDECRGSRYDGAGRVFAGQYADRNLSIPEYEFDTIEGRLHLVLGR